VPLKLGHSDKQKMLQADGYPAAGWINSIYKKGKDVFANIKDIPKTIKEFIDSKAYKGVSVEIIPNWINGADNKKYPFILKALSLLGADVPAVVGKGINQWSQFYKEEENEDIIEINFSENIEDTELLKRQALEAEKLKQEEIKKMDELQKLKEQLQLKENEEKATKEQNIALKEENEKLKKEQDLALSEKKKADIENIISSFSSEANMKIIPAQKEYYKELLNSLDDTVIVKFSEKESLNPRQIMTKILESMPSLIKFNEESKTGKKADEEVKHTEGISKNSEKLHALAEEIELKEKVSYIEALKIASNEHPELAEAEAEVK